MKISIFYFLIFISVCLNLQGQTKPEIDSLVNKGKNLLDIDFTKSLEYSSKAYNLSVKESYYWGQVNAAQWMSEAYYYRSELDSAIIYDDIALALSRKENDLPEIANNLVAKAQKLGDKGEIATALVLFKEAQQIMEARSDTFDLADLFLRVGSLYLNIDETDIATTYLNKSLSFNKQLKDTLNQAYAIGNLAIAQKKIGNVEKSIELTQEALEIYKNQNAEYSIFAALVNLGVLQKDLGNYDQAQRLYDEAENYVGKVSYPAYEMGLADNKGILYNILGRYKEAKVELLRTLQIAKEIEVKETQSDGTSQLAKAEYYLGRKEVAFQLLDESIALAKEAHSFEKEKDAHQIAIEIYKKEGNSKKLIHHLESLAIAKDSLYNTAKTKQVNNFQIKYETAKKDAEIELLSANATLDKTKRTGLITGLVLLAIAAGTIVFSLIQKRRKDKQIFEQEKEIETAKRINAEQELEFKKKELTAKVLQLARKNEFLGSLENELDDLKNNVDEKVNKTSSRIVRLIKRDASEDKEWEQFGQEFSSVHQGFFDTLTEKHGTFTQSETRLLALLKMNLSSKDIADTLRISDEGIKKARYRLRKKLNLKTDDDLQGYLAGIT